MSRQIVLQGNVRGVKLCVRIAKDIRMGMVEGSRLVEGQQSRQCAFRGYLQRGKSRSNAQNIVLAREFS